MENATAINPILYQRHFSILEELFLFSLKLNIASRCEKYSVFTHTPNPSNIYAIAHDVVNLAWRGVIVIWCFLVVVF